MLGRIICRGIFTRPNLKPAIFINKYTRVICQGIDTRQVRARIKKDQGTFYTARALKALTGMVGGVSPKKSGAKILGLPIFKTVAEAKEHTRCDATVIHNPPETAAKAMMEAIDAEIKLIVCTTQNVPQLDIVRIKAALRSQNKSRLIGPSSSGIVRPDECLIGTMPGFIFMPGCIAIISRSASLAYEAACQTSSFRLGQSICIVIGSAPFHGMGYIECLEKILQDKKTKGNSI